MGVVNQIIDLDNSSKPLPYKSVEMFTVGVGAPDDPKPIRYMPSKREADLCFRRDVPYRCNEPPDPPHLDTHQKHIQRYW